jgi:chromosome partitioning related protein ParA
MPNTTVISVVSTKGGVGKTTLSANIAALVAGLGLKVLAIDGDMQPSLSKYYRVSSQPTTGLAEIISRGGVIYQSDITETDVPGVDIIMSNMDSQVQAWLRDREDRLVMLKRAVRQPIVQDKYDLVIFDTQGAKGELQRSAAMAADLMFSPVKPDMMSFGEFQTGTLDMLASLNAMSDFSADMRAAPLCLAINCMDRTLNARSITTEILESFRNHPNVRLLNTRIPNATAYELSRTLQRPAHLIDKPGQRRISAYEVMHRLVFELLPHLKGLWVDEVLEIEPMEWEGSSDE